MQASNTDNDISSITPIIHIPYTLDIQQEDNLSIDILELYKELLPSKEGHDKRTKFVALMEKLLNTEWPDHDIKANVFGSSVNDLGTSSSDVDLCITTPWNGLRNVRLLAKLFRKCGMQQVVCVPRAKVPIVRLFDPELQLSCDINVNNTLALLNTKMIKTYVAIDPRVRPLIMTIKHWTKQRQLNDAANGGTLSSYTWTCMIINFLQQREPPILPVLHAMENEGKDEDYFYDHVDSLKGFGSENHESLGGLLFAFFRRFSVEFDYDEQVVSVRQGRYLSKKEKHWDTGRNKISLCVEEPCNASRNLGNSADVASVRGLRCEFERFLDLLLAGESLDVMCAPYQPVLFNTHEIPTSHNSLSLTLPTNHKPPTHPYDRRRSMVDGIMPSGTPVNAPRFSSSQAFDSILKTRNMRHGSHPLPPVPSRLLSMLNISANHGTDQSVDRIFARYHNKKPPAEKKNTFRIEKKAKRRSSTVEWPSISTSTPTATTSMPTGWEQPPQRSRRWSTIKKQQVQAAAAVETQQPKKPTLADIVKVHAPPSPPPRKPPVPTSTKSNSSSSKSKRSKKKKSQ